MKSASPFQMLCWGSFVLLAFDVWAIRAKRVKLAKHVLDEVSSDTSVVEVFQDSHTSGASSRAVPAWSQPSHFAVEESDHAPQQAARVTEDEGEGEDEVEDDSEDGTEQEAAAAPQIHLVPPGGEGKGVETLQLPGMPVRTSPSRSSRIVQQAATTRYTARSPVGWFSRHALTPGGVVRQYSHTTTHVQHPHTTTSAHSAQPKSDEQSPFGLDAAEPQVQHQILHGNDADGADAPEPLPALLPQMPLERHRGRHQAASPRPHAEDHSAAVPQIHLVAPGGARQAATTRYSQVARSPAGWFSRHALTPGGVVRQYSHTTTHVQYPHTTTSAHSAQSKSDEQSPFGLDASTPQVQRQVPHGNDADGADAPEPLPAFHPHTPLERHRGRHQAASPRPRTEGSSAAVPQMHLVPPGGARQPSQAAETLQIPGMPARTSPSQSNRIVQQAATTGYSQVARSPVAGLPKHSLTPGGVVRQYPHPTITHVQYPHTTTSLNSSQKKSSGQNPFGLDAQVHQVHYHVVHRPPVAQHPGRVLTPYQHAPQPVHTPRYQPSQVVNAPHHQPGQVIHTHHRQPAQAVHVPHHLPLPVRQRPEPVAQTPVALQTPGALPPCPPGYVPAATPGARRFVAPPMEGDLHKLLHCKEVHDHDAVKQPVGFPESDTSKQLVQIIAPGSGASPFNNLKVYAELDRSAKYTAQIVGRSRAQYDVYPDTWPNGGPPPNLRTFASNISVDVTHGGVISASTGNPVRSKPMTEAACWVFGSRGGQVVLPTLWTKLDPKSLPPAVVINGGCAMRLADAYQTAWPKEQVSILLIAGYDATFQTAGRSMQYVVESAKSFVPKLSTTTAIVYVRDMPHMPQSEILGPILEPMIRAGIAWKRQPTSPPVTIFHDIASTLKSLSQVGQVTYTSGEGEWSSIDFHR
eukprot:TRINITY_DN20963_c0_g1_i1.p1 TRINITY_DN20963_c0_g1~~TRINITY_DN20963_c0_g1_i1.p1  ORF type:complete len:916 (+),score=71.19 TRINITY_DN20963_c0_g1_i1:52-2799(+)